MLFRKNTYIVQQLDFCIYPGFNQNELTCNDFEFLNTSFRNIKNDFCQFQSSGQLAQHLQYFFPSWYFLVTESLDKNSFADDVYFVESFFKGVLIFYSSFLLLLELCKKHPFCLISLLQFLMFDRATFNHYLLSL